MTTTPTEKKESKQPKQLPAPNSDFYEFAQTLPAEELAIVKRVREYMEELGLVTRVLPDQDVLATATETENELLIGLIKLRAQQAKALEAETHA